MDKFSHDCLLIDGFGCARVTNSSFFFKFFRQSLSSLVVKIGAHLQ